MDLIKFLFSSAIVLLLLVSHPLFAQMSSSQYAIPQSVADMAGGGSQSTNFGVSQVVGQPSPVGEMGSTNFEIMSGFFYEPIVPAEGILVSLPDTVGGAGEVLDIPITIEDISDQNILSLTIVVETETAVLTPTGVVTTGSLLAQWGAPTSNIDGGEISLTAAGAEPLAGAGILVFIRYQVNPLALVGASSVMDFTSIVFNEGDPAANASDGSFTVSAGFDISGLVAYYSNQRPVSEVTMTLDGFSTTTDAEGEFLFEQIAGGNYTLKPDKEEALGSSISAYDASFILRHVVSLITLTPQQMIAADVSGNGGVSAFDASYILRYVVHLINDFPVGSQWKFVPTNYPISSSNWATAPDSIGYFPLSANQADQDFQAIVYGDVSGNWTQPGMEVASFPKGAAGSAELNWGDIRQRSEHTFELPINARINGDLLAGQIQLQFDPAAISLDDISLGDKLSHFNFEYRETNGKLNIAFASASPVTAEMELLKLNFCAGLNESNKKTILEIVEVLLNDGQITANYDQPPLLFNPTVPQNTELFQNYPNPFNPETTIKYQLKESDRVTLKIFDLLGKEVTTLLAEVQEAGRYAISWNGADFSGRQVATGVYFYRLETANYQATKKLLLIR